MDRIWRSGIMAGVIGAVITLVDLVVLGSWFKVFTEQTGIFLLLLLLANLLAFVVAGMISGMLVTPYVKNEMESLKSGMISGCIVASFSILLIAIMFVLRQGFISGPSEPVWIALILLIFAAILISPIALAGLISLLYTSSYIKKKRDTAAASAGGEEGGLEDLKALYDDLWKDARTLVTDMNRSILLYFLAGVLMLIYGFVILAYAVASWQRISSGSPELADYAAAIGETIGGVIQLIVGPLLIRWYFKLKTRYAKLTTIEKGDVR